MTTKILSACALFLAMSGISFAQQPPTFTQDVLPIFERHCHECHYEGAPLAPMSLNNYNKIRPWIKSIKKQVATGGMPPWHADSSLRRYANERALTDDERETIVRWVDARAPRGPGSGPAAADVEAAEWRIGEPDLVVDIGTDFPVPAEGLIPYQYFTVPISIEEDTWVKAIEVRPGNYELTHHVSVYVRNPSEGTPIPDAGPYGQGLLASYYRGHCERIYPDDAGKLIKKGASLIFQVHYIANGRADTDRSKVAFRFHDAPVENHVITRGIANAAFVIPPHTPDVAISASYTFAEPIRVLAMRPLMRARGVRFTYTVKSPGGNDDILLDVNPYTFRWTTEYEPATPIDLPAGATIECRAIMDNSHENVWNPQPHDEVRAGETMSDEIMIGWIDYVISPDG